MRRTTFQPGGRGNWRRLLSSSDSSKLPWRSYGLVRSDEEITQRQEPVHGDLDVVIGLVKQHKNFEEDLKNKTKQVKQLKQIAEALGTAEKEDAVMIKDQMIELTNRKKKPKPSWIPRRHPSAWIVWRARNNRKHIFSHNGNTHSLTGTRNPPQLKRRKQIL